MQKSFIYVPIRSNCSSFALKKDLIARTHHFANYFELFTIRLELFLQFFNGIFLPSRNINLTTHNVLKTTLTPPFHSIDLRVLFSMFFRIVPNHSCSALWSSRFVKSCFYSL